MSDDKNVLDMISTECKNAKAGPGWSSLPVDRHTVLKGQDQELYWHILEGVRLGGHNFRWLLFLSISVQPLKTS